MEYIHKFVVYTHIVLGSFALVLFWIPIIAAKGSKTHNRYGHYYNWAMYGTSILGVIACILVLIDPMSVKPKVFADTLEQAQYIKNSRIFSLFLLMLSLLVLVSIYHGERVLKVKANNALLRTPLHLGLLILLAVTALVSMVLGVMHSQTLLMIFSGVSLMVVIGNVRYIFTTKLKPRAWIIEHLIAMLGSGIGVYTAFSAFGGRHIFSYILGNDMVFLSWILPSVIGVVSISWSRRYFEKKFKVVK
ncbi:hypothetical protein PSECIP111951_02515 [Pseudoalteromonas holothuriae]|uniref:DUF2306 domain-containing protein n=1 Tax=Pseudoalteromonas holothuriae TaxID=2963714 RepID=A0A9W4VWZ8_9GAMM|nr:MULTISPECIES: hypothetical protein [unclassified Pseudoalteromonas]CAH9053216.1 hypothetical protein PSECIP111854_01127 [Pseudoalteromonas sp. CIP111854]CAH9061564.1 hypothetical protein PSECIP111951_02515 [Pseudoalteromonas sp. CIP111951]